MSALPNASEARSVNAVPSDHVQLAYHTAKLQVLGMYLEAGRPLACPPRSITSDIRHHIVGRTTSRAVPTHRPRLAIIMLPC